MSSIYINLRITIGPSRTKIAVGLSGGVDSSVAAALLKDAGCNVIGITMQIYDDADAKHTLAGNACYGPDEKEDLEAAAQICDKLQIPFYPIDLRDEYRQNVIGYFRQEYLAGRTPNPCVRCNQTIKFGFLLTKAREAGIEFEQFATGHYARIVKQGSRFLLRKAEDHFKDQTYFLYRLSQEQLSRTLFPLGNYTKSQVREMARTYALETAERAESQDFIAGGDYTVLFDKAEINPGDIVDTNGQHLGRHKGVINYTVGQRKGLGLTSPRPLYVKAIDGAQNKLIVSDEEHLHAQGLIATDLNLIAVDKLERPHKVKVKVRARSAAVDATVLPHGDDRAKIVFKHPQPAIAPGQSAVFYEEDTVVGGGIIDNPYLGPRQK